MLKIYLKTTMCQQKFDEPATIAIIKEISNLMDLNNVVESFI